MIDSSIVKLSIKCAIHFNVLCNNLLWWNVRYWKTSSIIEKISYHLSILMRVQYSFNILSKIIISWLFVLYLLFGDVWEFYFINFSQTFKCPFTLQQDVIFSNALLPFSYPLTWINSRCWLVRVEKKGFSCLKENILRTVTIEMIGKFSSLPRPLSLYISSYFFVPFLLFSLITNCSAMVLYS